MPFPVIPVLLGSVAAFVGYKTLIADDKKPESRGAPSPVPGPSPAPAPGPEPGPYRRTQLRTRPAPSPAPLPPVPVSSVSALVTARNGLNVRTAPNTSSAVLTIIPFNGRVSLPEPNVTYPATGDAPRGWKKVITASGLSGYGSAEWLSLSGMPGPAPAPVPPSPTPIVPPSPGPSPAPAPAPIPPVPVITGYTGTVTAKGGLNVRSQPNTSGQILEGLVLGTRVSVLNPNPMPSTTGAPKGWYNVKTLSGKVGYVSAEWLMVGEIPQEPPERPELQLASKMRGELDDDELHIEPGTEGLLRSSKGRLKG